MTQSPHFTEDFRNDFDALLTWRRDVRHFQTRPLEHGALDDLLDRACMAPSVGNSQPWRFVRVVSPRLKQAVIAHVDGQNAKAALGYSDERRTQYGALKLHGLAEAPEHLCVFCETQPDEGLGLGRQTMPETLIYSTVLAIHNLWLAARVVGIGLGWVSILDPEVMTDMMDVPASWKLVGYLCLGYPETAKMVPELVELGWQEKMNASTTRFER